MKPAANGGSDTPARGDPLQSARSLGVTCFINRNFSCEAPAAGPGLGQQFATHEPVLRAADRVPHARMMLPDETGAGQMLAINVLRRLMSNP